MVTAGELFSRCVKLLGEQDSDVRFDVRCIFEDLLGERIPDRDRPIDEQQEREILSRVKRLSEGYPLQYLSGRWEFMGMTFKVGEGALIPRPDTETLAEYAAKTLLGKKDPVVCDLCSGTGCLGIFLERKLRCETYCVELYEQAFGFLEENIRLKGSLAKAVRADALDENTPLQLPMLDMIVCNPPYLSAEDMQKLDKKVSFEPATALYGGEDGLDYYRTITRLWKKRLLPEGKLAFEVGAGMDDQVSEIMIRHGFRNVRSARDLSGIPRIVYGDAPEL